MNLADSDRKVKSTLEEIHEHVLLDNTLTLERTGQFRVKTKGSSHCGTLPELTIRYKMVCVCANKLDLRGFLFDQVKVDEFFQKHLSTVLSCEKLPVIEP